MPRDDLKRWVDVLRDDQARGVALVRDEMRAGFAGVQDRLEVIDTRLRENEHDVVALKTEAKASAKKWAAAVAAIVTGLLEGIRWIKP